MNVISVLLFLSSGCIKKAPQQTRDMEVKKEKIHSDVVETALGASKPTPSFGKESIDAQIKMRMESFHSCYTQALHKNPSLRGRLMIRFEIAQDGSVVDAMATEDTAGSEPLRDCVVKQCMKLIFPVGMKSDIVRDTENQQERNVVVSYPFLFLPE